MAGMDDLVVAGGTEMMSIKHKGMLPMGAGNAHLQELHPQSHQGVCADAIATLEGISREDLDAHAVESQRRAAAAIAEGRFDRSVVPVKNPDGSVAAGSRGVPPAPDHTRVPGPAAAELPGHRRLQPRGQPDLSPADQPEVPGSRHPARPPRR
jgi:acetyl-CoA acetyltransferase